MALFKVLRGSRTRLDTQEKIDGHAYFCPDDGSFHIDYTDDSGVVQRKQLNAKNAETLSGLSLDEIKESIIVDSAKVIHGEDLLSNILENYILTIDYDTLLAFDTSEIVTGAASTTSVLGQAILGQMVLA